MPDGDERCHSSLASNNGNATAVSISTVGDRKKTNVAAWLAGCFAAYGRARSAALDSDGMLPISCNLCELLARLAAGSWAEGKWPEGSISGDATHSLPEHITIQEYIANNFIDYP